MRMILVNVLAVLIFSGCTNSLEHIEIKSESLKTILATFENDGYKLVNIYLRKGKDDAYYLVISHSPLNDCEEFVTDGYYRSVKIMLFIDPVFQKENYENLFVVLKESECNEIGDEKREIAPDSEMIYEYLIIIRYFGKSIEVVIGSLLFYNF